MISVNPSIAIYGEPLARVHSTRGALLSLVDKAAQAMTHKVSSRADETA